MDWPKQTAGELNPNLTELVSTKTDLLRVSIPPYWKIVINLTVFQPLFKITFLIFPVSLGPPLNDQTHLIAGYLNGGLFIDESLPVKVAAWPAQGGGE